MTVPDITSALMELAQAVGKATGEVQQLGAKVDQVGARQDHRLNDHAARLDTLERHHDEARGAAQAAREAFASLDRKIRIVGAVVAVAAVAEPLLLKAL